MKIVYAILSLTTWLISRLPFTLLYILSDGLRFFLYDIARYRKKVVFENLKNSFPEKSHKEIKAIARKFYRNLSDIIVEVIKIQGISRKQLHKRFRLQNFDILEKIFSEGRSALAVTGHCGNWEWLGVYFSTLKGFKSYAVVKPLTNQYFHKYLNSLRLKYVDDALIDHRNAFREMIRLRNVRCVTLLVSDQTPTKDEIHYWTSFLKQDTAVFLGAEKIAKSLDQPVVFFDLQRTSRGHYLLDISLITDQPKNTGELEITEAHVKRLEEKIIRHPDNWLWSHRRWKHKKYPELS